MAIRSILPTLQRNKYKWYHGVLLFVGLNAAERGLEYLTKKINQPARQPNQPAADRDWYQQQQRPHFAPPGKAFPIAWTLNNMATIYGNLRVLNMPAPTPGRQQFLNLQTGSWLVYTLFGAAHFGLRSPINALVLTLTSTTLNLLSEQIALKKFKDKRVAWSLAPTLAWLGVAIPTAVTMAAWNPDSFYNTPSLIEPKADWLKNPDK